MFFSPYLNKTLRNTTAGLFLFAVVAAPLIVPLEASAVETEGQYASVSAGGSPLQAGSGVSGAVGCTAQLLFTLGYGLISGTAAAGGIVAPGIPSADVGARTQNQLSVTTLNTTWGLNLSNAYLNNFLSCVVRSIARAALEQMAVSTINWINSGFNGSPSFIQNYDKFFQNVEDQAFGEIISGTDLAFLCSPFQAQVKIALAQSYASSRRTPACTLTDITNNIDGFMNDFSEGGWPAFLSFTTTPTNNPFGGYMHGEAVIAARTNAARQTQLLDLQLGDGFLSFKQEQNCITTQTPPTNRTGKKVTPLGTVSYTDDTGSGLTTYSVQNYRVCDDVSVTPGTAIAETLNQSLGTGRDSLINAKYFDEIISALISQLVQNVLYSGLSTVSSGSGYGYNQYAQIDLSSLQNAILPNLPVYRANAAQLSTLYEENVSDIDASLAKLQSLKACWEAWANASSTASISQKGREEARAHASSTEAQITSLTAERTTNAQKVQDMAGIIELMNDYDAEVRSTSDYSSMQDIVEEFTAQVMRGTFPDTGTLNGAIEQRTTLTSELSATDTATAAELEQCHAFTPTSTE